MRVLSVRPIHGPNVYHHKPVLVMKLDLEEFTDKMSSEIPGFNERLIAALPGISEHHCSPGCPGGFIQRLDRGTYFAHIIEHIALELSEHAGIPVYYGKSVYAGQRGVYNVVTRFKSEAGMTVLLEGAVEIAEKIALGEEELHIPELIAYAKRQMNRHELGPSTKSIIEAAVKRDIPWRRIGEESLIQLGYGKNLRRVQASVTDRTSLIAADIVKDKDMTKRILADAGIPTPRSKVVYSESELGYALERLHSPWVIKPLDGNHGRGVYLDLKTPDEALEAFKMARDYGDAILVEEMAVGFDYRVLLVNYEIIAVAERKPAHVVGDGTRTVDDLIQIVNSDPLRGEGHENSLTKIKVDSVVLKCLAKQGLTLQTVPAEGQTVWLRETANISTGGTAVDVTDHVHPEVKTICERIARIVGLDICGIDLIHNDIRQPLNRHSGVIEVNAGPGLRMHSSPTSGKPRDVGGAIVDMLYPIGTPSRIPILAVTGTNGKTTVTRLLAHVIESRSHKVVGMTTSDGVQVNGRIVMKGDTTGPISARAVLSDPSVEVAVLETARGGLMRGGLAYDWSDVGIITNIRPDHIGQDGIEDIEDLVKVKSLIAERVRPGGTIVLNADDYETSRLMEIPRLQKPERRLVYYSLNEQNPLLEKHRSTGGTVFYCSDGWLIEANGRAQVPIVEAHRLGFTLNGTAEFQVSNALAVAAGARAYGLSIEQVAAGLKSFRSDEHNLGRANFYRVGNGYVMLDYGHNTDAILAIGRMLKKWKGFKTRGIIGLPGDRDTAVMKEAAAAAAMSFDQMIAREDSDLRGRKHLETPTLIKEVAEKTRPGIKVEIAATQREAVEKALSEIQDREVVVILYDNLNEALQTIRKFDPQPVSSIPVDQITNVTISKDKDQDGKPHSHRAWLQ
jgi:cyanophycin synthetase